ncbi:phosphoserine aminotransferase, partial [Obelidium mucronatum]
MTSNSRFDSNGQRILNFSAGPGLMPLPVLETAAKEMTSFSQGHSLMELSHRSAVFEKVLQETEDAYRRLLAIPDNYKVLFIQGGATLQFSMVALNLCGKDESKKLDYVVTGAWSQKGYEEAVSLLGKDRVNLVVSTKATKHNGDVPEVNQWKFSEKQAYVFYCDNETVHGVELGNKFPFDKIDKSVPIVCDMSSNILSGPIDVSEIWSHFRRCSEKHGSILQTQSLTCSTTTTYSTSQSMHNTPPTYPIYVCGLIFKWLEQDIGGLAQMAAINSAKAAALYDAIDNSNGFYTCPVKKEYRSRMNVPFLVKGGDAAAEKLFLAEAEKRGMVQLAGHRSVGGVRASIYNCNATRR